MKRSIIKMTWRSIRSFKGRYIALLLIVALSAGLFAGLKATKPAMIHVGQNYLEEQNFFDFRLVSTLGFTEEDADAFEELPGVSAAEGSIGVDALMETEHSIAPYKLISLPAEINMPSLVAGRMPQAENECVVDDEAFSEADIGTTIKLSKDNDEDALNSLDVTEFTIVGLVDSPLYLNMDRGTTLLAGGTPAGFIYLPESVFTSDVFTDLYITLNETADLYSDEYDDLIDTTEYEMEALGEEIVQQRYDDLLEENGIPEEMAAQFGIPEPECYVLTRDTNAGYLSFENDVSIISGIANIFPLFFILIAMMVCITTMSRMVDEERTQIGVLKATGYSERAITMKYLLYAGSATLIGWAVGFFLGTWGLPVVFWFAYSTLYDFAPMTYLFTPNYAVGTLSVAVIGILGSTWFSCRRELVSVPATLIRPRAPKNGKRIFLERISFIWKRVPFLQKVSLRNLFRYKRRLFMMLLGVSCCAALVVTAFGVRDSLGDLGDLQFENIQKYDLEVSYTAGSEEAVLEAIEQLDGENQALAAATSRVDIESGETLKSVKLLRFDTNDVEDFWNFQNGETKLTIPTKGEALIGLKIAQKLDLDVGDSIQIEDTDHNRLTVKVSGIFDNYVDNYIVLCAQTGEEKIGEWESNTIFLCTDQDEQMVAEQMMDVSAVSGITHKSTARDSIDEAVSCLDYIILLILICSGALAFIVIYNLTSINLAERSREIATVQVLGFYPAETESYVLRENLILSVMAAFIGLPLGTVFHHFVIKMILLDSMTFPVIITKPSYFAALIVTTLFAFIVNVFMKRRVDSICMAESLKAVE